MTMSFILFFFFLQVKAEIAKVLTKPYIRYLKNENLWPAEFQEEESESEPEESDNSDSSLIQNKNRGYELTDSSEDSSESSD